MRFAFLALLVVACVSTASATEYLWFEVVDGPATDVVQGPGMICEFAAEPGDVVTIGAFMTDDGGQMRGYGFRLDTSASMVGSNLNPDASSLWTSSGGYAGVGPLVHSWALTAGTPPLLGEDTATAPMIMSFDLTINTTGDIHGTFISGGTHYDGTAWGAYYHEAYIGEMYLPEMSTTVGHYAGYCFGNVIKITPEPAALLLLAVGAVALLRRR